MTASNQTPAHDTAAMLALLVDEGYRVTFTQHPSSRGYVLGHGYLVDLTGPLGSQATGLGSSPAAALASVWPLGGASQTVDDGQDDDVADGPAIAAAARKLTGLREYIGAVLDDDTAGRRVALERVGGELGGLGALLAADPADVEDGPGDELESYCRACGHWIAHFLGLDGWQHYRGEPAPGGKRTLYDACHAAVPTWCVPPGRLLAPACIADIRQALADAVAALRADCAGWCGACDATAGALCGPHDAALDRVARYRQLTGMLAPVTS
jgi:hypothetical protein